MKPTKIDVDNLHKEVMKISKKYGLNSAVLFWYRDNGVGHAGIANLATWCHANIASKKFIDLHYENLFEKLGIKKE